MSSFALVVLTCLIAKCIKGEHSLIYMFTKLKDCKRNEWVLFTVDNIRMAFNFTRRNLALSHFY